MSTTIVPRSIDKFNLYLIRTAAYLLLGTPANWSRFGWLTTENAAWQAFLTTWLPLYAKYSDKKGGYTTGIKDQLLQIIEDCVNLCATNHLLLSIQATRGVTITDLQTFNLTTDEVTGSTPHHITARVAAATDLVYPTLKPMGGGVVRCKCFTDAVRSGRAHKLKGFDMVEYRYEVIAQGAAIPSDPNTTTLIDGHSSKASFLLPTGTNNGGKVLVIFFRWAHSKHPTLDGPWNGYIIVTIL